MIGFTRTTFLHASLIFIFFSPCLLHSALNIAILTFDNLISFEITNEQSGSNTFISKAKRASHAIILIRRFLLDKS